MTCITAKLNTVTFNIPSLADKKARSTTIEVTMTLLLIIFPFINSGTINNKDLESL